MANGNNDDKRSSRPAKGLIPVSERLDRRLTSYALAAAAAGVATLACSPQAEAAPVCKNLSIQLTATTTYALNPANQVASPFNIAQSTFSYFTSGGYYSPWWNRGFFTPNSGGANVLLGDKSFLADVASGALIGPGGQFGKGKSYGLMFTYGQGSLFFTGNGTLKKHRGNFNLLQTNYIGFEFLQAGKTHYGWARLQVRIVRKPYYRPETVIRVLGYGYETAPDTAIGAGSCSTPVASNLDDAPNDSVASTSRGATLGMLAGGSAVLSLWKKDPSDSTGQP